MRWDVSSSPGRSLNLEPDCQTLLHPHKNLIFSYFVWISIIVNICNIIFVISVISMSNPLRCRVTSPPLVLSLISHHVSTFLLKHASLWADSSDSSTYRCHSIAAPSAAKLDLTWIKRHLLIYICIHGCFTSEWRHTRTRCRQREWAKNQFHLSSCQILWS